MTCSCRAERRADERRATVTPAPCGADARADVDWIAIDRPRAWRAGARRRGGRGGARSRPHPPTRGGRRRDRRARRPRLWRGAGARAAPRRGPHAPPSASRRACAWQVPGELELGDDYLCASELAPRGGRAARRRPRRRRAPHWACSAAFAVVEATCARSRARAPAPRAARAPRARGRARRAARGRWSRSRSRPRARAATSAGAHARGAACADRARARRRARARARRRRPRARGRLGSRSSRGRRPCAARDGKEPDEEKKRERRTAPRARGACRRERWGRLRGDRGARRPATAAGRAKPSWWPFDPAFYPSRPPRGERTGRWRCRPHTTRASAPQRAMHRGAFTIQRSPPPLRSLA